MLISELLNNPEGDVQLRELGDVVEKNLSIELFRKRWVVGGEFLRRRLEVVGGLIRSASTPMSRKAIPSFNASLVEFSVT
nr:hypothetical protein [Thermococcus sp.]